MELITRDSAARRHHCSQRKQFDLRRCVGRLSHRRRCRRTDPYAG